MKRILVIDSDSSSRDLLSKSLLKLGYETTLAESGEAGVRAASLQWFDP